MEYQVIIIGGGPAGLAAAIQLGRCRRSVLVIDRGKARSSYVPHYYNYLGLPQVSGRELLQMGREQAKQYGAHLVEDEVIKTERLGEEEFKVITKGGQEFHGRRLLFATGIMDRQPQITNVYEYAGKSLFYCLDCDGYEFTGKKAVVFGHNNGTAQQALNLLNFTDDIFIATNGEAPEIDPVHLAQLKKNRIDVVTGKVEYLEGPQGRLTGVVLAGGNKREAQAALSTYGAQVHSQLAKSLGVETLPNDHIIVNNRMETNLKHIYAVGDVINTSQLLSAAAAEGVRAAIFLHRSLLEPRPALSKIPAMTH